MKFHDFNAFPFYFGSDLDLESMSIGHRDALLVFRTLCKVCVHIKVFF